MPGSPKKVAFFVFVSSVMTGAGGGLLVHYARALPKPDTTRPAEIPGVVVEVLTVACGRPSRPATCYRPVVGYTHDGQSRQVATRSRYRTSSPHRKGDRVAVLVEPDGTAWTAPEWDSRQKERQRDYASKRNFPLLMGVLLIGVAAFGLLLAAGVAFAKPA